MSAVIITYLYNFFYITEDILKAGEYYPELPNWWGWVAYLGPRKALFHIFSTLWKLAGSRVGGPHIIDDVGGGVTWNFSTSFGYSNQINFFALQILTIILFHKLVCNICFGRDTKQLPVVRLHFLLLLLSILWLEVVLLLRVPSISQINHLENSSIRTPWNHSTVCKQMIIIIK